MTTTNKRSRCAQCVTQCWHCGSSMVLGHRKDCMTSAGQTANIARAVRQRVQRVVKSNEMKGKRFKEHWKWQRGLTSYPKIGKERRSSTSWRQKWLSDTSRERNGKVARFRGQTVIDGSSMGGSGREAACGWAVAQLDNDEENELWRAGYGTMPAEQFEILARSTFLWLRHTPYSGEGGVSLY